MSVDPNGITDVTGEDRQAYIDAFGARGVFAPGVPMPPVVSDDEKPRIFDYQSGINLYMQPRAGYGQLPFSALRNFADMSDAVRIVIEAIKREIRSTEWRIAPKSLQDETDYTREIERLTELWRMPDGVMEFDGWCNSILEDLLVYDAVSLWLDTDAGGEIVAVEQIDGSTIRPLLDKRGRTPRPPVPAYMQTIKGRNWQWFTADRLLYRPFNTQAGSPYGKSPIEFLILRINESLRRQFASTAYWDQTNVPEAMAYLPSDWSPENIAKFQDYFDAMLVGDIAKLRRIKFMPAPGGTPIYEFRRPDATANNAFDEWLLKMTCYAFGFLPSELGLMPGSGLGGKGFMDGQENALYRFGIGPLVQYLQNLFSGIVARQTKAPLVWRFKDLGPSEDKAAEAQLLQMQLNNGIIDINVWRAKAGQPPIDNVKPFILVGGVPTPLDKVFADMAAPAAPTAIPAAGEPAPMEAEPTAAPSQEPIPAAPEPASPAPIPSAADKVAPAAAAPSQESAPTDGEPAAKAVDTSQDGWEPPQAVQRAAKMGLELRQKFGRGGTEVGVARARDLSNGKRIPPETVNRMLSYFARHAVDAKADGWEDRSDPSAGWIAWLLWGGDAGRDWVQSLERRYGKAVTALDEAPDAAPAEFVRMALEHWREKAVRRLKDGKRADCDPPTVSAPVIPPSVQHQVRKGLALAGDVGMVSAIFKAVAGPKARALSGEHARGCTCATCRTAGLSKAADKAKMTPQERKVYAALLTVMGEAGDDFAETIGRGDPISLDDFDDDMLGELKPLLRDIMEESIYDGEDAVGYALGDGVASTRASDWAEEYAGDLIDDISDTTRELVGNAVSDYLTGDMTMGELADALQPAFGESRAEAIAVTEVTRAAAAGMKAYQNEAAKAGVVMERISNSNNDDLVCPICGPLNGVPESEWEDPEGPPWHPRCRCFVTFKVTRRPAATSDDAADDAADEEGADE